MPILITGLFAPSGGPGSFDLYAPEDIQAGSVNVVLQAVAGGAFKGGSDATSPAGEIVAQVKTTTGAPTHSASLGTLCWNSVDLILYVNNNGATGWTAIGAGGGANHNLLDGSVHPDTLAGTVVAGDLVTGNATPKWARLAKGATGYVLKAGATILEWGQVAWSEITGKPSTFPPDSHHASHQNAGSDEVATATPAANAIPKAGAAGTLATGFIPDLSATYAIAAKGVTNGDSHDHVGGDGAQIDHGGLAGLGDDDHTQYQLKSLLTTLGDIIYATAASAWARLAGNTTTTRKFLRQTGDGTNSAAPAWDTLVAADIPVASLYSIVDYVFAPDAAPGATIVAGDQQGNIYHSGPSAETAIRLLVDAETAPGASGLPVTIQYGDTNDLDTVATWTTIATYTLSSEKSGYTDTMTNASIPANRLIRMNIGTIVGTPADATITLRCKRALST
jgi:hypothetical protein